MAFEGQINYEGTLVSQVTIGEGAAQVTSITIRGRINQLIEEQMIEETSAFVLKHKSNGLEEQINSDRSPALFVGGDPNRGERLFDEDEHEIERVESAQAA